jgi:indolepyruvate ferredoxin oxidoreductase
MNHAGTAKHGGVLLVAGDDHGAYSSTLPHQSDHIFSACMIPMLYPCNVQEYLDLGLHAWAMSRFSGCAVGFKALADTVESTASVDADPFRLQIKIPEDFVMPEGGLNTRLSLDTLGIQARKQEALMQDYKIYAALAYARANKLNHVTIDSPQARLGIVASGKSYLDVLEALEELGIDENSLPRSVSACIKSRCRGRWNRMAYANLRKGWMKFWSSKKNARWWNTSSKNSCITGVTMCVRA